MNFNIVFHRKDLPESGGCSGSSHIWDATRAGTKDSDVSIGADKQARDSYQRINLNDRCRYHYDSVMFVDNVEPMEHPHRRIPSIATYHTKDEPLGFWADAIYFGYGSGFKSFGSILDRKSATECITLSIRSDQVTNEPIKSGSEIVNGVSDNTTQGNWDSFLDLRAIDILAGLRVYLTDQAVRVGIMEDLDRDLEVLNVAFGPFNF